MSLKELQRRNKRYLLNIASSGTGEIIRAHFLVIGTENKKAATVYQQLHGGGWNSLPEKEGNRVYDWFEENGC